MSTCKTLSPISIMETPLATFDIIACVGGTAKADVVVPHALALGKALQAPVTLLQVLDAQPARETRPDPVEWDLRRHQARRVLGGLAGLGTSANALASIALAEGRPVDEICRFARDKAECLLILGRRTGEEGDPRHVGSTVHNVAGRAPGSVLLVPTGEPADPHLRYRRILVPMDGSPWAESVLPMAVRLAKANDAELILAHVVPEPELTEIGPLEPEDLQLAARVVERNEHAALTYLARIKAYLADNGVRVRTVTRRGDDARASLIALIGTEAADIVILSARGHGGRHHAEQRYGSMSAYLMAQSPVPLLIMRPCDADPARPVREEDRDLRRPSTGRA